MSYFLADVVVALAAILAPQTNAQIVYGEEGFNRVVESGPHVQVLEDPAGDVFELAPTTQGGADPSRYRKWTGVLIKFKAESSKSGATIADHRGIVEALVDVVVVSLQELAHSHKHNVRNMAGAFIVNPFDADDLSPSTAYYELRFQYARALNVTAAVGALTGLVVGRSVIAHRLVVPPTPGASITGVTSGVATVGGLAGIDDAYVGRTLTLTGGSNAGNDGDFVITAVVDDATVQITNSNASVDTDLTWSVSDDEAAQES